MSKQPNLFSEIYEIIYYIVTQMMQLNEALEHTDDDKLKQIYKKILSYKDLFNPDVSSPMSMGSDSSLDGIRFFNGTTETDHIPIYNGHFVESPNGVHKVEKARGSSDLNACMIIAEAYNNGYKFLDLFGKYWNDDDESSDEEMKQAELENGTPIDVISFCEDGLTTTTTEVSFDGVGVSANNFSSNNGFSVMKETVVAPASIPVNGIDANLAIIKQEIIEKSLGKIPITL